MRSSNVLSGSQHDLQGQLLLLERVSTLCLIGTSRLYRKSPPSIIPYWYIQQSELLQQLGQMVAPPDKKLRAWLSWQQVIRDVRVPGLRRVTTNAMKAVLDIILSPDRGSPLAQIIKNSEEYGHELAERALLLLLTLLINSDDDGLVPLSVGHRLYDDLQHATKGIRLPAGCPRRLSEMVTKCTKAHCHGDLVKCLLDVLPCLGQNRTPSLPAVVHVFWASEKEEVVLQRPLTRMLWHDKQLAPGFRRQNQSACKVHLAESYRPPSRKEELGGHRDSRVSGKGVDQTQGQSALASQNRELRVMNAPRDVEMSQQLEYKAPVQGVKGEAKSSEAEKVRREPAPPPAVNPWTGAQSLKKTTSHEDRAVAKELPNTRQRASREESAARNEKKDEGQQVHNQRMVEKKADSGQEQETGGGVLQQEKERNNDAVKENFTGEEEEEEKKEEEEEEEDEAEEDEEEEEEQEEEEEEEEEKEEEKEEEEKQKANRQAVKPLPQGIQAIHLEKMLPFLPSQQGATQQSLQSMPSPGLSSLPAPSVKQDSAQSPAKAPSCGVGPSGQGFTPSVPPVLPPTPPEVMQHNPMSHAHPNMTPDGAIIMPHRLGQFCMTYEACRICGVMFSQHHTGVEYNTHMGSAGHHDMCARYNAYCAFVCREIEPRLHQVEVYRATWQLRVYPPMVQQTLSQLFFTKGEMLQVMSSATPPWPIEQFRHLLLNFDGLWQMLTNQFYQQTSTPLPGSWVQGQPVAMVPVPGSAGNLAGYVDTSPRRFDLLYA